MALVISADRLKSKLGFPTISLGPGMTAVQRSATQSLTKDIVPATAFQIERILEEMIFEERGMQQAGKRDQVFEQLVELPLRQDFKRLQMIGETFMFVVPAVLFHGLPLREMLIGCTNKDITL